MLRKMQQRAITLHAPLLAGAKPESLPVYQKAARKASLIHKRKEKIHEIALRNSHRELQQTRAFALSQRLRIRIEHIFAEAKEHHGLRRSRYRTLTRQQEQANLTATVQNLKRLVSFIDRNRPHAVALAAVKTNMNLFKPLLRHLNPISQPVLYAILPLKIKCCLIR